MGGILVTGGAGYIGSHVIKFLGQKGCEIIVLDNLSTGNKRVLLFGKLFLGDIRDKGLLDFIFSRHKIDVVMHFAAHTIVPESVENPLKYYDNNVCGTAALLQAMNEHGIDKLIFSSTAAVYDHNIRVPIKESAFINPGSPYGWSKAMAENIIADLARSSRLKYIILRYFNVAGADPDGQIGESKNDVSHLITRCVRAAAGLKTLEVYGSDYPTPDGTCIRDYIHVTDLSEAHVLAWQYLMDNGPSGILNCGYSKGYSVMEVIEATRKVTGIAFPVVFSGRRKGDAAEVVADCRRIKEKFNWQPQYNDLEFIIETAWKWERLRAIF